VESRGYTPDGRQKCFAYNKGGCKDPKCARAHVCLRCNGPHPAFQCPGKQAGGKGE